MASFTPQQDVFEPLNQYDEQYTAPGDEVGRGASGVVRRATRRSDGLPVAVKTMDLRALRLAGGGGFSIARLRREVDVLRSLRHPAIVRLYGAYGDQDTVLLVMELVEGRELFDAILSRGKFDEPSARNIFSKLCQAVAYMHARNIIHRDVKPENVLVCQSTKRCKIADLGCAREVRSAPPYTDYVSTRWYRAPENALRSKVYSSPVDVWACGCVLGELLMKGRPLFPATSEADLVHKIFQARGNPWQAGWQDGIRLATGLRLEPPADKRRRRAFPLELRGADLSGTDLCDALLRLDPAAPPLIRGRLQP